ncbi:MAG TPA: hypothetical protein VMX55_06470 [candidate division Zixibacteria bacterium]|nr:hypothetical protein [candidate division Zixibacteria bacterium]
MKKQTNSLKIYSILLFLILFFTYLPQIAILEVNLEKITLNTEINISDNLLITKENENPSENEFANINDFTDNPVFGEANRITPRKMDSGDYDVAIGPNDSYHCIWLQFITRTGLSLMYSSSNDSLNWTIPQTIYRMTSNMESPKIIVDTKGGIHIVMSAYERNHNRIYYFYAEPFNSTFSEKIVFDTREYEFLDLDLILTHNDTINIAWISQTYASNNLIWDSHICVHRKNITSGEWLTSPITMYNSSNPKLISLASTYDSLKIACVRSQNYETPYEILYTTYNETTKIWSSPNVVLSVDEIIDFIFITNAIDSDYLIWVQRVTYYRLLGGKLLSDGSLININSQINAEKTNSFYVNAIYDEKTDDLLVFYQESYGILDNIYSVYFFGSNSTWSTSTAITSNDYSLEPKVFPIYNNSNEIAALFYLDDGLIVSTKLLIHYNWTKKIIVYYGSQSFLNQAAAYDSKGTNHFICYHKNRETQEIFYQRKYTNESTWGGRETVTYLVSETSPSIVIDENDTLHIYFIAYDAISEYYTLFHTKKSIEDKNWINPEVILTPTSNLNSYYAPKVLYDEENNLYIFCLQIINGYNTLCFSYKLYNQPTFNTPLVLSNFQPETNAYDFDVKMDSDGTLHLVNGEYHEQYQVTSIVYRSLKQGQSWSAPIIIAASYDYLMKPKLIVDFDNNLELIFTESQPVYWFYNIFMTDFVLYTKSKSSSNWIREGIFLTDCGTFGYFDIVQTEENYLYMVYYEYDYLGTRWRDLMDEYINVLVRNPDGEWIGSSIIYNENMEKTVPVIIYSNVTKEVSVFSERDNYVNWFVLQNDTDGDSLGDIDELFYRTDPNVEDTDKDGLLDGYEVKANYTNPIVVDTDWDNLTDGEEILIYLTNPLNSDSDRDLIEDGDEVHIYGSSPIKKDTDDDMLNDYIEIFELGSNPSYYDTDFDGMDDWFEYKNSLNILVDDSGEDPDNDDLTNIGEYHSGTGVYDPDSDSDILTDGEEVNIYGTNPLNADTDTDTLTDWEEIFKYGTNPFLVDTDGDGFTDREEIDAGTDPNDPNDNPYIIRLRTYLIASIVPVSTIIIVVVAVEFRYRSKAKKQIETEKEELVKADNKLNEMLSKKSG